MSSALFRLLPRDARQRGLAGIGLELQPPGEVTLEPVGDGETVVRCRERGPDGATVGELEVAVFRAALVIDRDGILEELVERAVERLREPGARVLETVPVSLPGASGYHAEIEVVRPMGMARPPLPFTHVFAIASHDLGIDGGVLVTVRCATAAWPAADRILGSLRILTRRRATANDAPANDLSTSDAPASDMEAPPSLPLVGKPDD